MTPVGMLGQRLCEIYFQILQNLGVTPDTFEAICPFLVNLKNYENS